MYLYSKVQKKIIVHRILNFVTVKKSHDSNLFTFISLRFLFIMIQLNSFIFFAFGFMTFFKKNVQSLKIEFCFYIR